MTAPVWPGWAALPRGPEPKWEAVKAERLPRDPIPEERNVNAWVNRTVAYTPDAGGDHWQAPAETLRLMTGDCEDLAILKRAILIARGWPADDLPLLIVHDDRLGEHAILMVAGQVWDSLAGDPIPPAELAGLAWPIFAFSEIAAWAYGRLP